jgi:hypothetical protein
MSDEQDVTAGGWVDRGPRGENGATAVVPGQRTAGQPVPGPPAAAEGAPANGTPARSTDAPAGGTGAQSVSEPTAPGMAPNPTSPVGGRPRPRLRRPDPLVRMGPWAPVAGAGVGLVLGVVVVLLLAPVAETFSERLALVFLVLGLSLLGAGGTLLTDEVRLMRRGAWAAEARSSGADVIAGLLNGLTPARLVILTSSFVLLLSAYVTARG